MTLLLIFPTNAFSEQRLCIYSGCRSGLNSGHRVLVVSSKEEITSFCCRASVSLICAMRLHETCLDESLRIQWVANHWEQSLSDNEPQQVLLVLTSHRHWSKAERLPNDRTKAKCLSRAFWALQPDPMLLPRRYLPLFFSPILNSCQCISSGT